MMKTEDIRFVICGKMPLYDPEGQMISGEEIYRLYHYGARGSVIAKQFAGTETVQKLPSDSADLAEALRAVIALTEEHPDCPSDHGLFVNEIVLNDKTTCCAPRDALCEILKKLYRAAKDHAFQQPHYAGAFVCETAPAPGEIFRCDAEGAWDCVCGAKGLTSHFCINCGKKRPES